MASVGRHNFYNRNRQGGKKKVWGVPEGWVGCPSMGTGLVDGKFLVFKTPLKTDLNNKVPQADRFSTDTIFQQVHQMNHGKIGLWIDLTNTSRYYDASQIQNRGIQYQKLSCEGHGRTPSQQAIYEFCGIVHRFFRRASRNNVVAVHCTHGFNRTGYLICCYLIRFRKYSAAEAVLEFATHRQPGIYRQSYVNHLYTMTLPIQYPVQVVEPEWLKRDDDDCESRRPHPNSADRSMAGNRASSSSATSNNNLIRESHSETNYTSESVVFPSLPLI